MKRRKRSLWDIARDDVAENMKSLDQKFRRTSAWFLKQSKDEVNGVASTPDVLASAHAVCPWSPLTLWLLQRP